MRATSDNEKPGGGRQGGRGLAVLAAISGNAFEWYDFGAFGFMTPVISALFLPKAQLGEATVVLSTTALFGVGFVTRPLGGIVLGLYGDRHGHQRAMVLGMVIMAAAMALMAFAPPYRTGGIVSVAIVVVARLLQGFSVGGEFATSTTSLIEMAPPGRRGFFGSWQMTGQVLAQIMGAALGYAVTTLFSHAQLYAYAWRIPFLFGLAILPLVFVLRRLGAARRHAGAFAADAGASAGTALASLLGQRRQILTGMGLVAASTVSFYIIYAYVVTYATTILHLPMAHSYQVQLVAAGAMVLVVPFSGYLSDLYDRRTIMTASLLLYAVMTLPLYAWLVAAPSIARLVVVQIALSVTSGMFLGTYCTFLVELVSREARATALAVMNNVVVLLVGGFAQFIVTWLVRVSGLKIAPSFFVLGGVLMGLAALASLPARRPRTHGAGCARSGA